MTRVSHTWKETTPEGDRREVRVTKFSGEFRFQSKLRDEVQWTYHDAPLLADLKELRDVVFRKYQRRRAPYEDVVLLDKLIEKREADEKKPE